METISTRSEEKISTKIIRVVSLCISLLAGMFFVILVTTMVKWSSSNDGWGAVAVSFSIPVLFVQILLIANGIMLLRMKSVSYYFNILVLVILTAYFATIFKFVTIESILHGAKAGIIEMTLILAAFTYIYGLVIVGCKHLFGNNSQR